MSKLNEATPKSCRKRWKRCRVCLWIRLMRSLMTKTEIFGLALWPATN